MQVLQPVDADRVQLFEGQASGLGTCNSRSVAHLVLQGGPANLRRIGDRLGAFGRIDNETDLVVLEHIHDVRPSLRHLIDPMALEVAASNLALNQVGRIMTVSGIPLAQVEETFDLVAANLTAALLTDMAEGLTSRIDGRGWLLLGGILAEQVEEVVECFRRLHFRVVENLAIEEWVALLLRRKA